MSKRSAKSVSPYQQLTIFDIIKKNSVSTESAKSAGGQLRAYDRLQAALRNAIKKTPMSRHQIAGEMSHLLDETITREMIDSWTRESDGVNGRLVRHIPAEYLPAFCRVTGDNAAIAVLGEIVGLFVLPGPEAMRAEIQKLDEEAKRISAEKKKRQIFLKEMEK